MSKLLKILFVVLFAYCNLYASEQSFDSKVCERLVQSLSIKNNSERLSYYDKLAKAVKRYKVIERKKNKPNEIAIKGETLDEIFDYCASRIRKNDILYAKKVIETLHYLDKDLYRKYLTKLLKVASENMDNNFKLIEMLVNSGANINTKMLEGNILHYYIINNGKNLDVIRKLITFGVNINEKNDDGWSPLFLAAISSNSKVIKEMIELGADISVKSNKGESILFAALNNSDQKVIETLVELGADINEINGNGVTVIYNAVAYCSLDKIMLLIKLGANINIKDLEGFTPLHVAAMFSNNPEVITKLVELGADINAKTIGNMTPLSAAMLKSKNIENSNRLIELGASIK